MSRAGGDRVVVLAIQADDERHARLRDALGAMERPAYEIHRVTSPESARAALHEHSHDAFLIDRDLGPADVGGLDLAREVLAADPHAAVVLLDDQPDRDVDLAATAAGIAQYLPAPDAAGLERALRYAVTHAAALRRLAESEHDALHDALTGLPNRALFRDRLDQALRRSRRRDGEASAAVLFLDLDRFKVVNDSLGHLVGDRLLVEVGRRLESALRPTDTVARLGGDEFTVLLTDVVDARGAILVAERIHRALRAPIMLGGRELFVDASIGIALARGDATPEDVMRDADVAMYRAKADGRGSHAVFDAEMHAQLLRRLDLEAELRAAIEAGALQVAYQPIVQAATGRIVGFEALCRWPDGRGGFHDPAEFMPVAEETGLIVALGAAVLREACVQVADWRQRPGGAGLTVGVNVAHRQLADAGFAAELAGALRDSGLHPEALRLEVKEQELSGDAYALRGVLAGLLEEHGVRSHIDGFGTGASSLRLLHRFPGDAVKIHRHLVIGMGHDAGAFEIVRALVGLAHNLGLEVVAEGVENAEQLDHLKVLGCEYAQGFHISAPLAPGDAVALLRDGVPTGPVR